MTEHHAPYPDYIADCLESLRHDDPPEKLDEAAAAIRRWPEGLTTPRGRRAWQQKVVHGRPTEQEMLLPFTHLVAPDDEVVRTLARILGDSNQWLRIRMAALARFLLLNRHRPDSVTRDAVDDFMRAVGSFARNTGLITRARLRAVAIRHLATHPVSESLEKRYHASGHARS